MESYEPLLSKYGTKSPADLRRGLELLSPSPQTCAEVSATPKFDYDISQNS
jgi:hypothetical protein